MTERRNLGKYEIIKELGRGGFGIVYEARDKVLDRHVALKALHGQLTVDPLFLKRFEQEAKLAAQLEHPNLVPVYDFGQDKGHNYIVIGLMKGGSLKDHIEKNGALESQQTKKVFEQVLEGVSYIHQNDVIHRDLKPSNILFDQHGVARISDLGFAKAMRSDVSSSMSTSGGMIGTAAYMAPEIWHGKKATEQADIYSLGCIAYEMLTGKMLFFGETPAETMTKHLIVGPQLDASLPDNWRKLIEKCLAKDLSERYQTAKAVLEDLNSGLFDASHEQVRAIDTVSVTDVISTERYQIAKEVLADLIFDLFNTPQERVQSIDTVPMTDMPLTERYQNTKEVLTDPKLDLIDMPQEREQSIDTAPVTDVPCVEYKALVELFESTNGAGWENNTNWLQTKAAGDWYGVEVSNGHVKSLSLSLNQLTGTIPASLGNLTYLTELWLDTNQLTGTIPASLGKLKYLMKLSLYTNQLTGIIPASLGNLKELTGLWLHDNQLTGNIPASLGNLKNLTGLWLHDNQLTGTIPTSLGNLSNLKILSIRNNHLTGKIPVILSNLLD
jgi:serine/threonine protein kinase